MRVSVDLARCQRNGVCARVAPEVFDLGPDGLAVVVDEPPPPLQRAVDDAARRCPTRAIRVTP